MKFIAAINTRIYGIYYAQGAEVATEEWTRKQMVQHLRTGMIQASQVTAGAIQDALVIEGPDVTTTVDAQGRLVVTVETEPRAIDWLTDVDTTTNPPANADVLGWDSALGVWRPVTLDLSGSSIALADLSDVEVAGAVQGSVLTYDELTGHWVVGEPIAGTLVGLADVDVSGGLTDGETLIWDNSAAKWVPGTVTGSPGPAGPVTWLPPVPWTTGLVATTGPPATLVTYQGSCYVCILSHTNIVPTNGTYWRLVVSKGATGATGEQGPAGPAGPGVPVGGTTGQALKKSSNADYATLWATLHELIPGGTTGQALVKASNTDYDVSWATPAAGYTDEQVQDVVSAMIVDSATITKVYDDVAGTLTLTAIGTAGGGGGGGAWRGAWSTAQVVDYIDLSGSVPAEITHTGYSTVATPTTISGNPPTGTKVLRATPVNATPQASFTVPAGVTGVQLVAAVTGHPSYSSIGLRKNGVDVYALAWVPTWTQWTVAVVEGDVITMRTNDIAGFSTSSNFGQIELTAAADPYMAGEYVTHLNRIWRSAVDNNASVPGADGNWSEVKLQAPDSESFSYGGTLTAGYVGTHRLYNDSGRTRTLTKARASVGTAPTGASVVVDVNLNGTTAFTAKPTIAAGTNTGTATPSTTSWPDGSYLTVDIDSVGSTVAGADLTVTVSWTE